MAERVQNAQRTGQPKIGNTVSVAVALMTELKAGWTFYPVGESWCLRGASIQNATCRIKQASICCLACVHAHVHMFSMLTQSSAVFGVNLSTS